MTTDPRIIECAKVLHQNNWFPDDLGKPTVPPPFDQMGERYTSKIIDIARACILKWLAQQPTEAMRQAYECHPKWPGMIDTAPTANEAYAAMCEQAKKEMYTDLRAYIKRRRRVLAKRGEYKGPLWRNGKPLK